MFHDLTFSMALLSTDALVAMVRKEGIKIPDPVDTVPLTRELFELKPWCFEYASYEAYLAWANLVLPKYKEMMAYIQAGDVMGTMRVCLEIQDHMTNPELI